MVVPTSVNALGAGAVKGSPFRAPWGMEVPMSVNARGAGAVRGSPFIAPWGIVFEGRLRQCFRKRGGRVCRILKVLGVVNV